MIDQDIRHARPALLTSFRSEVIIRSLSRSTGRASFGRNAHENRVKTNYNEEQELQALRRHGRLYQRAFEFAAITDHESEQTIGREEGERHLTDRDWPLYNPLPILKMAAQTKKPLLSSQKTRNPRFHGFGIK
jgi:hypothetical protein